MKIEPEPIRLVIADDHPTLRKGLETLLSSEKDFSLLASVADGKELVDSVKKHQPDVVITDLRMGEVSGPEACAQIRKTYPETNIIVYSMYDSEDIVRSMRGMGVKGYLLKSGNSDEICKAIRLVYQGGEYYCASIRNRANLFFHSGKLGPGMGEQKIKFTSTELQVITLLCRDYSAKQIAGELKLKERTVQSHKEKIEEKMEVKGVVGIVVFALQNWLLH